MNIDTFNLLKSTFALALGISIITGTTLLLASEYGRKQYEEDRVPAVTHSLYREECGTCHFAYQPAFLPARSWQAMMDNLADHFGENAELSADTQQTITDYLTAHAADKYAGGHSFLKRIADGDTPLRITETPFFRHEHDELPTRLVQDNVDVQSFSRCNTCHTKAEQGIYDEDTVKIPNYGRWDD
ncbi:diheme cytochrome c [Thioflexithrix psekupsensis]|uniref:Cytochrome C n=1 Tax=Thioflexithrix psekupsensis TaxID=1570016 RepID=A0A251X5K7_9GAMM|nr:diheme cytochrome c [Thioflexithrix psekupsensis]OUD12939.1 hypothetical protein TPSD3_12430 [Thioflexithrix psekupsensis]